MAKDNKKETKAKKAAPKKAETKTEAVEENALEANLENLPWEPKITALVCNWCTYAGADLAGTSRMDYKPNVRIIKLPCTGRIDPLFIIKAFENGADGVLVSGCHPGDCHYSTGNYHARRRWMGFNTLMEFTGIDMRRLHFSWVSASEAIKWVDLVNNITDEVKSLGPFVDYQEINF
ncbi:MAG: hydrogenase iron-sulfur subunit [Proteobacteria bacterium]|nr:hydrogenase iron-sulfur subunit [Pseudomonadota bacterium]